MTSSWQEILWTLYCYVIAPIVLMAFVLLIINRIMTAWEYTSDAPKRMIDALEDLIWKR